MRKRKFKKRFSKKLKRKYKRKKERSLISLFCLINLFLLGGYLFLFAKVQEINYLLQKKEKEKFILEKKVQSLENIFESSFPKISFREAKEKFNLSLPKEIKYLSLKKEKSLSER